MGWLLLLGCQEGAAAPEVPREAPPAPVEVTEAKAGSLTFERRYLGEVRSLARASLAAGADGAVREVTVREGDRVRRGQRLVAIDPRLAKAELAAARASRAALEAERAQAERDAAKYREATARLVPGVEIERAAARADQLAAQEQSQAAVASRAEAALARHRVDAPFDGVVVSRLVDPGDWVTAGQAVVEVLADRELEVVTRVDAELKPDLEPGQAVTVLRGQSAVPSEITAIVPAVDPVTRTMELRIAPREVPPWLLVGEAVEVVLRIDREAGAGGGGVLVPRDALVEGVVDTRVVEVEDGKAAFIVVSVLERGAEDALVQAPELAPGDVLVVRGNERLRPGQAVQVQERDE